MNKLALLLTGVALVVTPCTNAFADEFTFSYNGPDFGAAGTITAAQDPAQQAGILLISAVTGTAYIGGTDYTITGLDPVNTYLGNDNDFYSGSSAAAYDGGLPFDFNGFAFLLSNGDSMTLYANDGLPAAIYGTPNDPFIGVETGGGVGATFTPEPESLTLLGTGVLAMAGLIRRRLVA